VPIRLPAAIETGVNPGRSVFLEASARAVWVADTPDTVVEIDAQTGDRIATLQASQNNRTDVGANIEVTRDAIWVTDYGDDSVSRFDLRPTG
jgi:DNA-binding beta-propeller fold protein YncE